MRERVRETCSVTANSAKPCVAAGSASKATVPSSATVGGATRKDAFPETRSTRKLRSWSNSMPGPAVILPAKGSACGWDPPATSVKAFPLEASTAFPPGEKNSVIDPRRCQTV